ncbi:MAG TPA: DNA polymerase IV [Gammaproteobacteria bacterium]|nr:DNA polymerase IV [Gammaproteobacteria bacterium]
MARLVAHVDMDAFYASVEQHDQPELAGRPVIVGGRGRRSVVCAASYEARRFGVRSAMPGYEARQRCPEGIFLPVRMTRYREVSRQVFTCFAEFTPHIEALSLDEAFLDVTARADATEPLQLGHAIKRRILECTGLKASVGFGPNKLVAKIASDRSKPDGLLHIAADQVRDTLDPLPVTVLWGIGPRTAAQLERAGIRQVLDLRQAPDGLLAALFGNQALRFRELAQGHDERPVAGGGRERSVSQETTFDHDLTDFTALSRELHTLTRGLCEILKREQLHAHTLVLKLRTTDFRRHTRQRRFTPPGNRFVTLWPLAQALLKEWLEQNPRQALRLLGVGARDFVAQDQLGLFARTEPLPTVMLTG